jgi:hypothetical protein
VQHGLPLAGPTEDVAALARTLDLAHVAAHGAPAPDLPRIVVHAAAEIVAAVPLEPAARIIRVDPALRPPYGQRLARVDAEEVERRVAPLGADLIGCPGTSYSLI